MHLAGFGITAFFKSWKIMVLLDKFLIWLVLLNRKMKVRSSKYFCSNAGVPSSFRHKPMLFRIFIIDFPDDISSQLGSYADDTAISYCFSSKSDPFDKSQIASWPKEWPVIYC